MRSLDSQVSKKCISAVSLSHLRSACSNRLKHEFYLETKIPGEQKCTRYSSKKIWSHGTLVFQAAETNRDKFSIKKYLSCIFFNPYNNGM